jgi:hypothetical protein
MPRTDYNDIFGSFPDLQDARLTEMKVLLAQLSKR